MGVTKEEKFKIGDVVYCIELQEGVYVIVKRIVVEIEPSSFQEQDLVLYSTVEDNVREANTMYCNRVFRDVTSAEKESDRMNFGAMKHLLRDHYEAVENGKNKKGRFWKL